jgi:SAM-dependent methyltransferase
VRVKRDFVQVYAAEVDPWQIGDATGERYDAYYELLLRHAERRGSLLDAGSGFGAFLSRFQGDFDRLTGLDISERAVREGSNRYPDIRLLTGSIDRMNETALDDESFDAIICSDVICYLREPGRRCALSWIARHLSPGGVALIAAWSPGGKYLDADELRSLVERDFRIIEEREFNTGHVAFAVERKRHLVALTFDYETWQPVPPGKRIHWEKDVFQPTEELLEACDREDVRITLFAEAGEYIWLRENEPATADRMAEQWRRAVNRGHEIGLHLHPSWLPELGARRDGDQWDWDWSKAKANDYPGDLSALIGTCKRLIEEAVAPAAPNYRVRAFRAGAYQAQPFHRLHDALAANGLLTDSSVFAGGVSIERGYDYALAWSSGQPYFASPYDPQLKAVPAEQRLVEMPIFTFAAGDRLLLDGRESERLATRLLAEAAHQRRAYPTSEQLRRRKRLRGLVGLLYIRLGRLRRVANTIAPRRLLWMMSPHGPDRSTGHVYYVAIGHTKGDLRINALIEGIVALRREGSFEFLTLSDAEAVARDELERGLRDRSAETAFQVRREYSVVLGEERNDIQSHHLQSLIPLDRERVLDFGCGAGYWAARIAERYPWMQVVGTDVGEDFIARAVERYSSSQVSFERADFLALPFPDESFDCVYADNTLEHAFDVQRALSEVHRVLREGGVLIAAVPSDARNPHAVVDNHTWKTAPHDVADRLRDAGFSNVWMDEVDVLRTLKQGPYPSGADQMIYVRAWKRAGHVTEEQRAVEAMDWVYTHLDPSASHAGSDAASIFAGGTAFCTGYAIALGELLEREGIRVRWATMIAEAHPRGRGPDQRETHEVIEAILDNCPMVLDPMTNSLIRSSLSELFVNPLLAPPKLARDNRYLERDYHLYDTAFWYERVTRYWIAATPNPRFKRWRRVRRGGV